MTNHSEEVVAKMIEQWKEIAVQNNLQWKNSFVQWNLPAEINADFSLNLALPIAHKSGRKPQEVAKEIVQKINQKAISYEITQSGYINFSFTPDYLFNFLKKTVAEKANNLRGENKNVRINLEYVSANPTGYLHLAHLRQAVIGTTLANVYQFLGYPIIREYYINDRGRQVEQLAQSIKYFYYAFQNRESGLTEKELAYTGQSSKDIAQLLIEIHGSKFLEIEWTQDTQEQWKKEILQLMLKKIKADLEQLGVNFDVWTSEASLYQQKQDKKLLQELATRDLIYSKDGALFFRSTLKGDDKDRVIIKEDGEYTYFFSDIIYHRDKLKRSDRLINILGADHHGYLSRLRSCCQLLTDKPIQLDFILVQMLSLSNPQGKNQKFSKRLGNAITLREITQVSQIDQLKFFLLEKEANQSLALNLSLLAENQKNTRLYYIQYAHARCQQILSRAQEEYGYQPTTQSFGCLNSLDERKIINLLVKFPFVLNNIVADNKHHYLIHYLHELASQWQSYYQKADNLIIDPQNTQNTVEKLLLVKAIKIIIAKGLELMGLQAPERL